MSQLQGLFVPVFPRHSACSAIQIPRQHNSLSNLYTTIRRHAASSWSPPAQELADRCVTACEGLYGSSGSVCGKESKLTSHFRIHTGSARSSLDGPRDHGEEVTKEDETVVDAEQGSSTSPGTRRDSDTKEWLADIGLPHSALAHHLPAAPRSRPEPSHPADLHPRAAINAGAHNKVRGVFRNIHDRVEADRRTASWPTPRLSFL